MRAELAHVYRQQTVKFSVRAVSPVSRRRTGRRETKCCRVRTHKKTPVRPKFSCDPLRGLARSTRSDALKSITQGRGFMEAVHGSTLLVFAVIAIALLILMITRYKVYPFLVLIIVSLLLGLAVGMPMSQIVKSFETGNGNTLGHIAIVVGLGTMLGKMMAESGGAERIATSLIDWFGEKNIHWAMMFVAIIVGLPVFFEVGFVLLIPIAFNVAKRTGQSLLLIGLPSVAGLSVVHGLIPPHPAALLAVQAYHADIGRTIVYGLIVGVPTAIVAGPLFALLIHRQIRLPENNPLAAQFVDSEHTAGSRDLPSFGITLFTVLLPVI